MWNMAETSQPDARVIVIHIASWAAMSFKAITCAAVLFTSAACIAATTAIVKLNVGTEARIYTTAPLLPRESVYFQYPDKNGAARCCQRRASASFELVETDRAVSDSLADKPIFSYRLLNPPSFDSEAPFLGAAGTASTGDSLAARRSNPEAVTIRSRTGNLTVTTCIGQEGFHVFGNEGARVVAELYVAFDYEVGSPTCPIK